MRRKFKRHPGLAISGIRAAKRLCKYAAKAEALVVGGCAEHDRNIVTELAAASQPVKNHGCSQPPPPMRGKHTDRSESHRSQTITREPAEQHVSSQDTVSLADDRYNKTATVAQPIDQPGFQIRWKCLAVNIANRLPIVIGFQPHLEHVGLLIDIIAPMAAKLYDVVIVGAGASGGTLAGHLAQLGVSVALMEGGPKINTRTDFNTHGMPFHFANRHIPTMKPGKPGFDSERSRGVGGKSLTWNAVAWRFSQRDFKGRTHDGAGEDWPIDYKDIAPYYDRIEDEVGVCGNRDGLEDLPDGHFLPPVPMKCSDMIVKRGAAKLGVKVIHVRKSTLSRPKQGRPACHFCGNCMAGCDVAAKYNSADVHIAPAMKTGKLEVFPNSIVREVALSAENRVTGVRYLNRETMSEGVVNGRTVVVSCACVQSVALLMMSKSRLYPNGLANSSGQLGKNFIPHFTGGVQCFLGDLVGKPAANDEGFLDHAYVPSFMHNRKRDYARSFGVQFNYQNRRSVGWARDIEGFGKDYKKAVQDRYPAFLTFSPYGEMLPNAKSFVDLDYAKKDAYGLPFARRNVVWMENDMKIFRDMTDWSRRILEASGAEILAVSDEPRTNHELGGCRMGSDPKTSVVNRDCQTHDVKNLFVVDGSVFPSASEKNPTHTMMALAARLAEHLGDRLKKGSL